MLDEAAVGALGGAFTGVLIGPGDREYESARRVWNAMVDRRTALIARCADQDDVVAAVRFARERGLPLAVRGAGHNVAGNAVCDAGVVLDLSAQRAVEVDPVARTARVGPGALLGDVDRATQAFGLATPTGNVSLTGVAGLTLGGGLGWIARKHGPACDNLLSAQVVTADGRSLAAVLMSGSMSESGQNLTPTPFRSCPHEQTFSVYPSDRLGRCYPHPRTEDGNRALAAKGSTIDIRDLAGLRVSGPKVSRQGLSGRKPLSFSSRSP